MKIQSKFMVAMLAVALAVPTLAETISGEQAKKAMNKWIRTHQQEHMTAQIRQGVETVETVRDADGRDIFHVVKLSGGGFVVAAADNRVNPVIAFSESGELERTDDNPLWSVLNADVPKRLDAATEDAGKVKLMAAQPAAADKGRSSVAGAMAAWAELLDDDDSPEQTEKDEGSPSLMSSTGGQLEYETALADANIRVPPMTTTKWNQSYDIDGNLCYNYYTPNHYPCGCVATATAQLMRYHNYPNFPIGWWWYNCWVDYNVVYEEMMYTGDPDNGYCYYQWNQMPNVPSSSCTLSQRQQIGKLCYDIGVVVVMNWTANDSSACFSYIARALADVFQYASAKAYVGRGSGYTVSTSLFGRLIYSNLDAGYPVLIGTTNGSSSSKKPAGTLMHHSIVVDGYGLVNGTVYAHMNCGWSGSSDAWYSMSDFTPITGVIYNVFPYSSGRETLSGRITDEKGQPYSGVKVVAKNGSTSYSTTSNARGVFALMVPGGRAWTVTVTSGSVSQSRTVSVSTSTSDGVENDYIEAGGWHVPDLIGTVGNSWGNDFTFTRPRPTNDNFASATTVSGSSGAATGTNVNATQESGEPLVAYKSSATTTVWWKWTAPASGSVQFDTIGTGFDTVMGVYRGTSLASLAKVVEDDDGGGSRTSKCVFSCVGGTTYYVCVGGYGATSGTIILNWKLTTPPTAPTVTVKTMSDKASSLRIGWSGSTGATSYGIYRSTEAKLPNTAIATMASSPYDDDGAPSGLKPGVQYHYWVAAINSGGKTYSTVATGHIPVSLSVNPTGVTIALNPTGGSKSATVTANTSWTVTTDADWISIQPSSGIGNGTFTYQAGKNSGLTERKGTITVTAGAGTSHPETRTFYVEQDVVLVNDDFASATAIGGDSGSLQATNSWATIEKGEPLVVFDSAAEYSMWWVWTAPESGTVQFDTLESKISTVMGVYIGTDLSSLTTIDEDVNSGINNTSICNFECVRGEKYYIAVAGHHTSGAFKLNWEWKPVPAAFEPSDGNKHYGLFVGVDKYVLDGCKNLSSCTSDAAHMREACEGSGRWKSENCRVLLDSDATKANVRTTLAGLANTAKSGDTVLFYQTSHGGWKPNTTDTHLCMYNKSYLDSELAKDLSRFRSGVKLVVMVDACHSGGLFKGNGMELPQEKGPEENFLNRVRTLMRESKTLQANGSTTTISADEIGWMTAANYYETATETENYGGEFTRAFLGAWYDLNCAADGLYSAADGKLDFHELFLAAQNTVTNSHPQCAGVATLQSVIARQYKLLSSLSIEGPDDAYEGMTRQYACRATMIDGSTEIVEKPNWNISKGDKYAHHQLSGEWLFSSVPSAQSVTIEVSYTIGKVTKTATKTVTVHPVCALWEALDTRSLDFTTGGDADWFGQGATAADGVDAAHSGLITRNQGSWLQTTVCGSGVFSFRWRVSSKPSYGRLTFSVDGRQVDQIDGKSSAWPQRTYELGEGNHTLRWTYSQDDDRNLGADAGYVDQVVWTPTVIVPNQVALPVAEVDAFMARYPKLAERAGGEYGAFTLLSSAAGKVDANGNQMQVWQDIVAGTDPTDPTDKFTVSEIKFENGEIKVKWHPDLNEGGAKSVRQYTEWGRKTLGDGNWTNMEEVTEPEQRKTYLFRKVTVEMP